MNISSIKNNQITFKGLKPAQFFVENPSSTDFIGKIALNSAVETMKSNSKVSFIPAGSWISGNNYDPLLSDHDFTILLPNNSYQKMEADIFDAKECFKETAIKRLKAHNIPEQTIQEKILPSINIFPTPQVKECFSSYDQFRDLTNLKISLHDNLDIDTGLWKMKGVVFKHFETEGSLLYLKKDGTLGFFRIKDQKNNFNRHLGRKGIYMPRESTLYSSDKLNIINEFVGKMQNGSEMSTRSFFKYLNRVKKFFFVDSVDDLFLIADDPRKNTLQRFQQRIKIEQEYKNQFAKITRNFDPVKTLSKENLPESFAKQTLKDLELFKRLAEEILSWPTLRGFK